MRSLLRFGLAAGVLSLGLTLAACDNFDPTALFDAEMFNTKKKLPGERHPVFPEGTPGVSQGVPPEMVKGYQPPPEPEATAKPTTKQTPRQAAADPAEAPKPKPKPKPKVVAKPADAPATTGTVQPAQPASQQSQWPEQPQAQRPAASASGWPGSAQPSGGVAWPEPPAQR